MTFSQPLRRSTLPLLLFSFFVFITADAAAVERRARGKAKAASASDKKRADKKADKKDKKNKKDSAKRDEDKRDRDKRDAKQSAKKADAKDKSKGSASRRERAAEARREAARREAERREAEERRREEAARRAEIARQARLAAIARARAAQQALIDETAAAIAADDTTGEDLEVRRAAIGALGGRPGTVVVMDPMNGRVYSIVNQEWGVRRGFKPCSTIKLVTGLAGVESKIIQPTETIAAWNGRYRLDLTDSLAYSNNTYFERVGGTVGFDRMIAAAREFGLGQPTGVNHARESAGRVPLFKTGYAVNHMSSHGDDFKVTPIQLAVMASAIANGGNLLVPHLPRTPEENTYFRTETRRRLAVQPESLRRLVPGMIGAVNYGSGRQSFDPTQTVGGKTGSCTDDGVTWLGLFTSYAPIDDPRLAVAVVLKGSGSRGKHAAGVAGRVYRALNHRFGRRNAAPPSNLANAPGAARPKLDAAAARLASDEEREADDETLGAEAATGDATNASENTFGIRRVMKPVTRPVETTTRPATPATSNPNVVPNATGTRNTPQANAGQRPRRVLSTSPQ